MFATRATTKLTRVIKRVLGQEPIAPRHDEWSIGIYFGNSPFDLFTTTTVKNPVLTQKDVTDVPARYVADPFMLQVNDMWFMFFEIMNRKRQKGEIGLAMSKDGLDWSYQQVVLREPFHLSYPYVFEWKNDYYMVPESFRKSSIRLYKAAAFPLKWCFVKTLLQGRDFVDPSLAYFKDKWWLFSSHGRLPCHADILRLFYADDPTGHWYEHPESPIVDGDTHIVRPGGRVIVVNGRVIRYAQDCHPNYGSRVRAFEVFELTTKTYREREVPASPVLGFTGSGWNATGMHHIDPHLLDDGNWLACVDGWRWALAEASDTPAAVSPS